MTEHEIFKSSARSSGDLSGVFEFDGETGYFYLYDQTHKSDQMIIDQIRILNGKPDFGEDEVLIRWDNAERTVGLLIRGEVWAVFDAEFRAKHGGDYLPDGVSTVPAALAQRFTG